MCVNLLSSLWKDSFTYKILLRIRGFLCNGLNKSFIVSRLLHTRDINDGYGLLGELTDKAFVLIDGLIRRLRKFLYSSVSNSYLLVRLKRARDAVFLDIYRFFLTSFGLGILLYGGVSLIRGPYSIRRGLLTVLIGALSLLLGLLDLQMDKVFMDSGFIRGIKKIFDYKD